MPKVGLMNGMKVLLYPGLNQDGVFVALHENKDVPLMSLQGKIQKQNFEYTFVLASGTAMSHTVVFTNF